MLNIQIKNPQVEIRSLFYKIPILIFFRTFGPDLNYTSIFRKFHYSNYQFLYIKFKYKLPNFAKNIGEILDSGETLGILYFEMKDLIFH